MKCILSLVVSILSILTCFAAANTEKIIFKAPPSLTIPDSDPDLGDLNLDLLSPGRAALRTALARTFPSQSQPQGLQSWYLLDTLRSGQRYEVRVCWAAVQPTQFWLDIHTLREVFDTPSLVSSLAEYSELQAGPSGTRANSAQGDRDPRPSGQVSLLFLQISSAADYFTTNKTLMISPPPVDVDIVLDPYLLNIFPRSLVPTALYISLLAVSSWFISDWVWKWLRDLALNEEKKSHTE